ncbi:hypothetical protein OsI_12561 [Oryza sativa Indica Group]|uniref:Uncharacterized protein n=1 Tax=Oryza sativa subsp. indica TaxID=39946 RepID=A2XJD9_ORYSI|nr:hypothetical protein OsI_12561 [Oryza sativa Indica Group]
MAGGGGVESGGWQRRVVVGALAWSRSCGGADARWRRGLAAAGTGVDVHDGERRYGESGNRQGDALVIGGN